MSVTLFKLMTYFLLCALFFLFKDHAVSDACFAFTTGALITSLANSVGDAESILSLYDGLL